MCVWGGRTGEGIIPRLSKVRTFDLSLCKSMDCCQPVEGGDFQDIQSRRNSLVPAQGCEILMSNRSEDDLGRMNRANFKKNYTSKLIFFLPTGKGQEHKALQHEFCLIGSVFQKEKFPMWTEESRETAG